MVSSAGFLSKPNPDPAQLRSIFGQNLRRLSMDYPSIAGLCRDLGINRTQFNRYLSAESFPRPDVLHRICQFFGTDARILLEPVCNLQSVICDWGHQTPLSPSIFYSPRICLLP